jgi:hypothetical protein
MRRIITNSHLTKLAGQEAGLEQKEFLLIFDTAKNVNYEYALII